MWDLLSVHCAHSLKYYSPFAQCFPKTSAPSKTAFSIHSSLGYKRWCAAERTTEGFFLVRFREKGEITVASWDFLKRVKRARLVQANVFIMALFRLNEQVGLWLLPLALSMLNSNRNDEVSRVWLTALCAIIPMLPEKVYLKTKALSVHDFNSLPYGIRNYLSFDVRAYVLVWCSS